MFVLSSEPTEMVKACIDDSQTLHLSSNIPVNKGCALV